VADKHESDNVKLGDEPWTIFYTKHKKGQWGLCNHKQKVIEISRRAKGKIELDTLIHEMMHATCPFLDEFQVDYSATDIAAVLWKMGYRKP